jgi:hypothetical protein
LASQNVEIRAEKNQKMLQLFYENVTWRNAPEAVEAEKEEAAVWLRKSKLQLPEPHPEYECVGRLEASAYQGDFRLIFEK